MCIRNKFSATVLRQLQMAKRQLKQARIARIRCKRTLRLTPTALRGSATPKGSLPIRTLGKGTTAGASGHNGASKRRWVCCTEFVAVFARRRREI